MADDNKSDCRICETHRREPCAVSAGACPSCGASWRHPLAGYFAMCDASGVMT